MMTAWWRLSLLLIPFCLCVASGVHARAAMPESSAPVRLVHSLASSADPVVVRGDRLAALVGVPQDRVRVMAYSDAGLREIPFQIDSKDEQGNYILNPLDESRRANRSRAFEVNDELVFMGYDGAKRQEGELSGAAGTRWYEIELIDPDDASRRWVYVVIAETAQSSTMAEDYIHYDAGDDSIHSDLYRMAFSRETPFLVDNFSWRTTDDRSWSPNQIDTMKLKHRGKLFGYLGFERDHGDYTSELVALKSGPVRIIRRTANRVRVFWMLKTPKMYIDYIAHRNGFDMVIAIDIPFDIGLFFDNLESIASVDWRATGASTGLGIKHQSSSTVLPVDGQSSDEELRLDGDSATDFSVNSQYGSIAMGVKIDERVPVTKSLYLRDDRNMPDPPENQAGQFGNIGFRTVGWENIQKGITHMYFSARLRDIVPQGLHRQSTEHNRKLPLRKNGHEVN